MIRKLVKNRLNGLLWSGEENTFEKGQYYTTTIGVANYLPIYSRNNFFVANFFPIQTRSFMCFESRHDCGGLLTYIPTILFCSQLFTYRPFHKTLPKLAVYILYILTNNVSWRIGILFLNKPQFQYLWIHFY